MKNRPNPSQSRVFTGSRHACALVCGGALLAAACGSSSTDGGPGAGGAQATGGTASSGASGGTATGGMPQEQGGSGGAAGGSTPSAGSDQGGASGGGAGSPGMAGSGGSGGNAGSGGNTGSNKVLIYGVTTGFRHGSISAATTALSSAAAKVGLVTEAIGGTDSTNLVDPTAFTKAALAGYGAVILLANSGEPIGYPATQEIQNLYDYVQAGGALVGIEDATHCYDGGFNNHPASTQWISLVGADFVGHPGGVAPATCTKVGTNPSVSLLPDTFTTTDEIYQQDKFNPANQVVLSCVSSGDAKKTVRPISWIRTEGAGRYFYTSLGHPDASWTDPMDASAPTTRLVEDHVLPGLLWAMKR